MISRKGDYRFPYNGDHDRESIVAFVRYPHAQVGKKKHDSWSEDSDVVHLTGTFYIMFYTDKVFVANTKFSLMSHICFNTRNCK